MAEAVISSVLGQLAQLLIREEAYLLIGFQKEIADIRDELVSIQAFLKDADRRVALEGDTSDRVQTWVKQLAEVAFRIEDVIDEYKIYMAQQPHHLGCAPATLHKITQLVKTLKPRHQIASKIQGVKSSIREIKERSERYAFNLCFAQGSSSHSQRAQNVKSHNPQLDSFFIEEDEVVGIEGPRDELVSWLVEGEMKRTVISVVGMGGLGKTTLAKKAFDDQRVTTHFDCRACVIVSQSYTIEDLLKELMKQFCKMNRETLSQGFLKMDRISLISQLRVYLQQKRYVVFLDDVWNDGFWDEIKLVLPDYNNGSRIIFTTRKSSVPEFCKKSSPVFVHEQKPLPPEKAWELFCKRAYQFDCGGSCPPDLKDLSIKILEKCDGLPLAIVAIAGLLSTKEKTIFEWQKLYQNIGIELDSNPHLTGIRRILGLSFDDLPYNLKLCLLHFGIYPIDHLFKHSILIRQWIAEGFIQHERGRTPKEVAEQYLKELIHRSLVQVYEFRSVRKAQRYRIHDLLHEMIIAKMESSNFCHFYHEAGRSISEGIVRRLSISTNSNNILSMFRGSHTRSMYMFGKEALAESFWSELCTKFKLMKVLEFQEVPLDRVPKILGNLLHLRYLRLRGTKVQHLPRTIGKLQNLETLDLSQTLVREMPRETSKLKKLQHLMVKYRNNNLDPFLTWEWETGVQMKDKNIGGLTSLQMLYFVEVDHGGIGLIKELQKLRQLRRLGLLHVRSDYGKALCALINEMKHLEFLQLCAIAENEIMDLNLVSSPPPLRKLYLKGMLKRLPDWVTKLDYLVELYLLHCKLADDPLKLLKDLPSLSYLLIGNGYEGEILHFEEGAFGKLKTLKLRNLLRLKSILIENGALPVLQEFEFGGVPQLKEVPSGIRNLEKLQVLHILEMPQEFNETIGPNVGHWVIQHVPIIKISQSIGPGYYDFETHVLRGASHS